MSKRKKIIIDKKFQMKFTLSIIGTVFLIAAVVIGVLGYNAASNNSRLKTTVKKIEDIIVNQDHHIEALRNFPQLGSAVEREIAAAALTKNLTENISMMNSNISVLDNIVSRNTILIFVIIAAVVLQGVVFFFLLLKQTNRISGPIYVMTRYMKQLLDGQYPDIRPLRKNDEFTELYSVFKRFVEKMKHEDPGNGKQE